MVHPPSVARRAGLRALGAAAAVALGAMLAGCASLNTLDSVVASYGQWPTGRAPGTYAFERLPSQQAQPERQKMLEDAARPALEAAGFKAPPPGTTPEVIVQVGARVTRTDRAPWDDPLWWRGGFGVWRHGPWLGPSWRVGMYTDAPRYEREVAMLLRDRASGEPLYETRASSDGLTRGDAQILRAMFEAALKDFPATGVRPRTVTTPLTP
ncbi:MAG: DUF4136 domain-containing protein [Rubrivivax sp.]